MTVAPVSSGPLSGLARLGRPARALAGGITSTVRRGQQRLPDVQQGLMLVRRLAPVAVTLFLAQGFFLAGFFSEPLLSLPLGLLTIGTLVVVTTHDYRADVRQRDLTDSLCRQQRQMAQDTRRLEDHLLDDVSRLAVASLEVAAPAALLTRGLGVMGAQLVDLLATPSAARRERLLEELERTGVGVCAELAGDARGDGQAVLYRRVGGRFEPSWPQGTWSESPPPVTRTSAQAGGWRLLLHREGVAQTETRSEAGRPRSRVDIALVAGRRSVGVLLVERPGSRSFASAEIEAIVAVSRLLAAGSAGAHHLARCHRTRVSDRTRSRWAARVVGGPANPVGSVRLLRADMVTRLESSLEMAGCRQAVRSARSAGVPPRRRLAP